jgi:hypothetical protein
MEKPEVQFTQILKAGISTTVPTQHTQQQDEGSVVSSNTSIQIVHLHSNWLGTKTKRVHSGVNSPSDTQLEGRKWK